MQYFNTNSFTRYQQPSSIYSLREQSFCQIKQNGLTIQ